jgi:hypothetical protein
LNRDGGVCLGAASVLSARITLLGGVVSEEVTASAATGRANFRPLLVTARRDASEFVLVGLRVVSLEFLGDPAWGLEATVILELFLSSKVLFLVPGAFITEEPLRAARKADKDCALVGVVGASTLHEDAETEE